MELAIIFIRTLFFYFFIFFIYRLMGKREVGQLGIIDLIVSILIAELVMISIENPDESIWNSVVPIVTLTLLQMILAFFTLRNHKFRKFLDGNPSIIISEGKVNYNEMIKQKYNLDDLLIQIREKGYRSLEEIEYAILENNGTLSVFNYEEGEVKKSSPLPLPLVLDSYIQRDTLKLLGKDERWVYDLLNRQNVDLSEIFYAFYKDKKCFIIKNKELE